MSKKTKLILAIFFLIGVAVVGYYYLFLKQDKSGNTVADNTFGWEYPVAKFPMVGPDLGNLAYSDIRDPGGIPQGLPVRLKIPVIGVDSAIEDALITPEGKMDVPVGSRNVAWFALGPNPGEVGSAVIGGHFGIRNGVKFVFYDLDKLVKGDKIYIEDDKGDILAFQVRKIELFDRNDDATTVFTSDDGLAHLNLITCEGIWNRVNGNYPLRRVVFTDAIPTEGITAFTPTSGKDITKAQDLATFYRSLRIGARGVDVVALQNALEQVGISPGVADGYFGSATHIAIAKYQSSAGLSPDGVFGPFTRAKLLVELGGDTGLPDVGTENMLAEKTIPDSILKSPTLAQIIVQYVKSLYSTPIDGLITSLLVVAILFMTFKITRRT